MRRALAAAAMTLVATAASMSTATAQGEHFIGAITCTTSITAGLQCSGKAAGLGNDPTAAFLTADSVTAEYVCSNRGGNIAPGQGTFTPNPVGDQTNFTPRNGQITFRNVTLAAPPTPSADDICPNGNWRVNLLHLSWNNVVLHIQQDGTDILSRELGDFSV
ncbi:hypothetical protein ACODT5_29770 [Streptomyces sp. 5.8]|uniref:hypothetical protein n=1 Tax=Streptomyces sp. 5.8 TaxID=3406571 RepID=UPI003BB4DD59